MRIDFVNSSSSKVTVKASVHLIVSDLSFTHAIGRQMTAQRQYIFIFSAICSFTSICTIYCDLHFNSSVRYVSQIFLSALSWSKKMQFKLCWIRVTFDFTTIDVPRAVERYNFPLNITIHLKLEDYRCYFLGPNCYVLY